MNVLETLSLSNTQKLAVYRLWNVEYPGRIAYDNLAEFDVYLSTLGNPVHYLLADDKGCVEGWAVKFLRAGEKWFAIILHDSLHGRGVGTMLLNRLKENETALVAWVNDSETEVKRNGMPYLSPIGFYLKNGFSICPDVRLETEKISAVKISWKQRLDSTNSA